MLAVVIAQSLNPQSLNRLKAAKVMARTNLKGTQVLDGSVGRADLNTTVSGSAVITKLIASNGVAMTAYTGTDSGTGDVTVAANLTFLDTKYPSITTSRTQNHVLAAPVSGNGAASFRALVAGDIPAIAISGITGLQSSLDAKLSGSGTAGYLAKYTGALTQGNSVLFENSGFVGIGTISPSSKLSLGSFRNNSAETVGINFHEGVTAGGLPAYGLGLGPALTDGYMTYRSGTSSTYVFGHKWFVNNVEVMRVRGDGNFGIGINPVYKLDVNGTGHFAGNVTFDASAIIATAPSTANHATNKNYVDGKNWAISSITNLQTTLDNKWTLGGNVLVNTTVFGSTNNYNIQIIHNNVLAATVRSEGIADIKRIAVGRGIGAFDTFENIAAFGGNVTIGGWNSPIQNSYDLNMIAHTILDGLNSTRKSRFKWGYYSGADFVHKYKRVLEYRRTDDSLVIGSYSSAIFDTATTDPAEASSIYIAVDGSTSIGQLDKESMKFLVNGAVRIKSTLDVSTSVTTPLVIGGSGTASVLTFKATTGVGGSSSYLSFLVGNNGNVDAMRINNTGSVGFGTTSLSGYNIRVVKDFNTSISYGFSNEAIAQLASTTVTNFNSVIGTGADANPSTIRHYYAQQSASWAGSATTQIGYGVSSNLTGSVNTYAFRSDISAGSGQWNLYMAGTANNYINGSLGIGTANLTGFGLHLGRQLTGGAGNQSYGLYHDGQVQSDASTLAIYNTTVANTASGTYSGIIHNFAQQGTLSGTVTSQWGFYVSSTLTGATNNYGFRGLIPSGAGRWNLYMDGTANNYIAGKLGIGTTTLTSANINITLPITGNVTYYGILNTSIVQSDVTSLAVYYRSNAATQAVDFTLSNLVHFGAYRSTIGAGSSIGNQFGFYVDGSLVGATGANYGFYSGIASGSTNWNLFMAGSAANHMNGSLWIGTTTGSAKLDVTGTGHFTGNVTFDAVAICSIAPTSANHLTNKAYVDSLSSVKRGEAVKTISLTNITLSGTQTVNAVALVAGDLILVASQTTASQNGVYVVASGAWSRSTNNDTEAEIKGAYHLITNGIYANSRYINTNSGTITVGTTGITYTVDFGAEADPIWSAFQIAQDITPTRIGQWNTAYTLISGLTTTNNLSEGGTNLYFTTARVLATALTGYSIGANTTISASDTVLGAFQKLQGQVNNRILIGGNTTGAAITIGTNDAYDFNLERNNVIQVAIKSGVVDFNYDVNILGKIKLNGSTGVDHQFVKYNGTSTLWSTLDTGELTDKNDIVMLGNYSGERGFLMYSDDTKTYANALIYSNQDAGIALGLHGYSVGASDVIKEFGMQLDTDGNLYHRKLDGTRSRIATIDMIAGGGGNYLSEGSTMSTYLGLNTNAAFIFNPTSGPGDASIYLDNNRDLNISTAIGGFGRNLRLNGQYGVIINASATNGEIIIGNTDNYINFNGQEMSFYLPSAPANGAKYVFQYSSSTGRWSFVPA